MKLLRNARPTRLDLSERAGVTLGWLIAPAFALTSALRRARTFHPSGEVFTARVEPVDGGARTGEWLRGPALVRFSSALWKGGRERLDVLGCAIRFRRSEHPSPDAEPGDQDLLLATIQHPWTMPLAPLTTDVHDFLANDYFGVSPFEAPGLGRCYWRLRPERHTDDEHASRAERLRRAVTRSEARLHLEARKDGEHAWTPVAVIALRSLVEIDQARLRFSPFRDGRRIVPHGFVHGLRRGVYALSQHARPGHERAFGHRESPALGVFRGVQGRA
jgi:hypothetical protein